MAGGEPKPWSEMTCAGCDGPLRRKHVQPWWCLRCGDELKRLKALERESMRVSGEITQTNRGTIVTRCETERGTKITYVRRTMNSGKRHAKETQELWTVSDGFHAALGATTAGSVRWFARLLIDVKTGRLTYNEAMAEMAKVAAIGDD